MLELYDKDFKADITKMFQQVWNNWKKNRKSQQWSKKTTERGKKLEDIKKNHIEISELKDKITKILKLMGLIA